MEMFQIDWREREEGEEERERERERERESLADLCSWRLPFEK